MNVSDNIAALAGYGVEKGLIEPGDRVWAINSLMAALGLDAFGPQGDGPSERSLEDILAAILDEAVSRDFIDGGVTWRDLLDARLMGVLTPRPSRVSGRFWTLYAQSPREATAWYYKFSMDTDYIRAYRVAKDLRWRAASEYGELDITVNLSKPEKDPLAIAAARSAAVSYPKCQLCREAEGYAGRPDYPARENHRLIPLKLSGEDWYFQYSPYVYYNEHCIVLCSEHRPMRIDRAAFDRLLEFVSLFPHYFLGSNADLPIVGGSILGHDHFQGGCYEFPMTRAAVETFLHFPGYGDVEAGILRWPMSVIRLKCSDRARLAELGDKILTAWRGYTDESAFIFARTDGEEHNTVSPIARFRDGRFELDLALRNNIATAEHPLGVFHPHEELHHIKKENIGLIEVMGLAILPGRLQGELNALAKALAQGRDVAGDGELAKHAQWARELSGRYTFTPDNAQGILQRELGAVYARVLEQAGVFKRDAAGRAAFMRFIESV